MKKVLFPILALSLVLAMASAAIPVQAAEEDELEAAITDGVAWLADQQNPDGSWGDWDQVGRTGLAVVKLEDLAFERGYESPFDPAYEYSDNVINGLNYIFNNPGLTFCGLAFQSAPWVATYETGIAMMAIANSGDMDRVVSAGSIIDGLTYGRVLEENVGYLAYTQTVEGGWSYGCGEYWTDNSNSGYAVLGLRYAETAGIDIPQTLKDNLSNWVDYIQNADGGSDYHMPNDWGSNLLRTGNLLFQMVFVGDTLATQRVQDAIDYIERHWEDANWDPGWKGPGWSGEDRPHMQAAYCLMKGLESVNIQTLSVGGSDIDWFDEMADAIIASQIYGGPLGDGYWDWDPWGPEVLATEWALLTLERVVPPLDVVIDIKPWSDPNPINLKSKGVIPVAILTTDEFDAATVDPDTVLFAGAAPVHYAMEDVDHDGDMDMILHFNTQETDIRPGDTEATLTAQTYDGKAFFGTDSVRTIPKGP